LRSVQEEVKKAQENPNLHFFSPSSGHHLGEIRRANTQHNLIEERKKEKEVCLRFGGSETICFKSVIGSLNVFGFEPNLVVSFCT
jgi:hypothetical protein